MDLKPSVIRELKAGTLLDEDEYRKSLLRNDLDSTKPRVFTIGECDSELNRVSKAIQFSKDYGMDTNSMADVLRDDRPGPNIMDSYLKMGSFAQLAGRAKRDWLPPVTDKKPKISKAKRKVKSKRKASKQSRRRNR